MVKAKTRSAAKEAVKNPDVLSIETLQLFRQGLEAMTKLEKSYKND